eukprot:6962395-Lingulodinium_polyedra.AAC.1
MLAGGGRGDNCHWDGELFLLAFAAITNARRIARRARMAQRVETGRLQTTLRSNTLPHARRNTFRANLCLGQR